LINRKDWKNIYILLKLAELGAHRRTTKISTEYLADKLSFSQQTASRNLIELERTKLISRQITPEGSLIKITSKGLETLTKLQSSLQRIIEVVHPSILTLEGTVFTGLGEGAYYISKNFYKKQFIKKLGFDPYPGTLNLKLSKDYDLETRKDLDAYPAIEVKGFTSENRTFGLVKCYQVRINGKINGALVFALRGHYDISVLEIVAPVCLRKKLNLTEGQKVKIEVFISQKNQLSKE
jgi:riboflavin kinase